MDKFIGYPARNPNTPAAIKRRIASLRKHLSFEKKVANLLQKEQMLRLQKEQMLKDRLAMAESRREPVDELE